MAASPPTNENSVPVPRSRWIPALVFGALLPFLAAGTVAGDDLKGRVALSVVGALSGDDSIEATLGAQARGDLFGNFRLMWEPRWDDWDFVVHYELSKDIGSTVKLMQELAPYLPEAPPATLFDLSHTIIDTDTALLVQKIDRLSLGYSAPRFVVRVGRQALTWGAGTVFHPMDLINPFAPGATDTEYKPGVDMIYAQVLFDDGSDLQLAAVPRAATPSGPVTADASSFAARYHRSIGELTASLLLARDHGDWTAGLGLSGSIGGAVWNAEIVPTREPDGTIKTSGLANISGATMLFERNAIWFAEYFHNGFGAANGTALDALPADLVDRLARGQVFNTSFDYLAAGMTVEWTPLLTISPTAIVNLNDGSFLLAAQAARSINDNLDLHAGLQVPVGPPLTEFGGLPVSGATAPYVAPPATAFVELRQYF